MDAMAELLALQDGVVARRQLLEGGISETQVTRMLRRRELVHVHPGVYVDHNGPVTWRQRAWAAVLWAWPAGLDGWSAIRAHEGPGRKQSDTDTIHVVVDRHRNLTTREGISLRRASRFDELVQWNLTPPRVRYDDAVIGLADGAGDDLSAVAVLADACGGRRTTAARLRRRTTELPWLHRRTWLLGILGDVEEGTCSVLEHGYLDRVERPHALPRGRRQVHEQAKGRSMFRDVLHEGSRPPWQQIVELDGRLFHDNAKARDLDMERDLDTAIGGADTVRLGYGQVFDRSCRTAMKLGRLFQLRGWPGTPKRCSNCPERESAVPDLHIVQARNRTLPGAST